MIKSMLQNNHALPPSTAESRDTSPEQDTETVVSITSPLLGEIAICCPAMCFCTSHKKKQNGINPTHRSIILMYIIELHIRTPERHPK